MGDLEPLAEPAEVGGVLADDVAAAHRVDADLLAGARADLPLAAVARDLAEIALERLGEHRGHRQRRARRRVLLLPVVQLDDLDVVVVAERARRLRQEAEEHVHAERHVRRQHDRDALGRLPHGALLGLAEAGGADDHADVMLGRARHRPRRRRRRREVDDDVGVARARRRARTWIGTPSSPSPATSPASCPRCAEPGRSMAATSSIAGVSDSTFRIMRPILPAGAGDGDAHACALAHLTRGRARSMTARSFAFGASDIG